MTIDSFFNKWNGKVCDWDGYYGGQCVDLYRQYVAEVLGVPQSPPVTGAKDIWITYLSAYFTRISNSPTNSPQKGDIIIWGTGLGPYGHVAIANTANSLTLNSFDQNYPVGTKCHFQNHTYKGVLGWLRPRTIAPVAPLTPREQVIKAIVMGGDNDSVARTKIKDLLK